MTSLSSTFRMRAASGNRPISAMYLASSLVLGNPSRIKPVDLSKNETLCLTIIHSVLYQYMYSKELSFVFQYVAIFAEMKYRYLLWF